MTPTFAVRTEFLNGSFMRFYPSKEEAARSVVELLTEVRLGPASIMTIRQESFEESFAFIVTIGSWDDTATRTFFNEWWSTSDKTPADTYPNDGNESAGNIE